jgi:hypothetical protein
MSAYDMLHGAKEILSEASCGLCGNEVLRASCNSAATPTLNSSSTRKQLPFSKAGSTDLNKHLSRMGVCLRS